MIKLSAAIILSITAILYGCAGPDVADRDGAPANLPDMRHVPDAVPRVESPSRYGNPESYAVFGKRYHVKSSSQGYVARGLASWYGTKFHGRRTSSGEPYDMYAMTAAHKSLPLPTYVQVRNLESGRRAVVRVNDRGPFHNDRIIDLSYAAASKLGVLGKGTAMVEIRAIDPRSPTPKTPQVSAKSDAESIPAADTSPLYLQAGAFSDRHNAERLSRRLQLALGSPVRVLSSVDPVALYRVQIGPLASADQVGGLTEQLLGLGVVATHVVIE